MADTSVWPYTKTMQRHACIALFLLAPLITVSATACQLRIVYSDVAAPPYLMGDGAAVPQAPGIAVELVAEAASRIGCAVQWERLPNRRVQRVMEHGDADAMLMYSYSPERATYAVYPMKGGAPDSTYRLATLSYYIYTKSDSQLMWDTERFTNLDGALGVNAGYSVGAELRKQNLPVEEARSTEQNLTKLQAGRIAAYVMQDMPADDAIESGGMQEIKKLPVPFSTKHYFLAFSRQQVQNVPSLSTALWEQIAKTPKSRLEALQKKYRN
jgi:polar amino acid transport system substrate-binding protein